MKDLSERYKSDGIGTVMKPWDIIKEIFANKIINTDVVNVSILSIIKMLSFDKELLVYECDDINYFFSLDDKQWYQLLLVCFNGKDRYIEYIKKPKDEISVLIDEFQNGIKRYYNWSDRELGLGYKIIIKNKEFPSFLQELGFLEKDRKKILKHVKQ